MFSHAKRTRRLAPQHPPFQQPQPQAAPPPPSAGLAPQPPCPRLMKTQQQQQNATQAAPPLQQPTLDAAAQSGCIVHSAASDCVTSDDDESSPSTSSETSDDEDPNADAEAFEEEVRVGGYSTSTIAEFQRIWNVYTDFLRQRSALHEFLDQEGFPTIPLEKAPCVLFIKHLARMTRTVRHTDSDSRHLGSGTINNAIAALKYHGFRDMSIPHALQQFFRHASKSQARKVARERQKNGHEVASEGLTWPALKLLLQYARCHDPDLHCFLVNLVQAVSRGERVSDGQWLSLDWVSDHMTCHLVTSKCDQAGKFSYPKQFFWSPDPDFCWLTALGRRILTTPPEQAGPHIYKNNTKENVKPPVQRYERRLKVLLQRMPDGIKAQLGVPIDHITLHSLKRTAYRYLQNFPVDPVQLSLRAEHRTGLAFTYSARDIGANPNADASMGRLLANCKYRTNQFYIVPPHFSNAQDVPYERIVPMYASMQATGLKKTITQFNKVLPFLIAAVLQHYHDSNEGLQPNDPLFGTPMWSTQARIRNMLFNRLQGAGRPCSSIEVTGRCNDHDQHMMLVSINNLLQQQTHRPQSPVGNGSEDNEVRQPPARVDCEDDAIPHLWANSAQKVSSNRLHCNRELLIKPMTIFESFVRYFVGSKGRLAFRHLISSDIPKHLTVQERKKQRSLLSKMKYVLSAVLGQTRPECIDANNAALIYDRLVKNVASTYGECVTHGCLRTAYNKMRKNPDAHRQCCIAPQVSIDPPRQMLMTAFKSVAQPGEATADAHSEAGSDASSILEIDDDTPDSQCCNVEKCLLCPYCDEDVLYTYKTRKTLLEHVRSGHCGLEAPHPKLVKEVDSQKDGQSNNARWIRAPNSIARLPTAALSTPTSPYGKPANLSSSIRSAGSVRNGSFIEVYNESSNDRWFLLVADGRIMGNDTHNPHLISAYWCLPNKLDIDRSRASERISLASIIKVGDKDAMAMSGLSSKSLPSPQNCRRNLFDFFSPVGRHDKIQHTAMPEDSNSVKSRESHANIDLICITGHNDADGAGSGQHDNGNRDDSSLEKSGIVQHNDGAEGGERDADDIGDCSSLDESGDDLDKCHEEFQRKAKKMTTIKNAGRGNCLFHAVKQGAGCPQAHDVLRSDVVWHARQHLNDCVTVGPRGNVVIALKNLLCPNGTLQTNLGYQDYHGTEQYFQFMNQKGTWGEEMELASAALFLGACIHVYSPSRTGQMFQYFAPVGQRIVRHVYLLNADGRTHYECLQSPSASGTPQTQLKRRRGREAIIVPAVLSSSSEPLDLNRSLTCIQHGGTAFDKDCCLYCNDGRNDMYIRDGVVGYEDSACTRGECLGCETCPIERQISDFTIPGHQGSSIATEEQKMKWWQDAVATCPEIQQDNDTFAWTHFVKHSDKDRQNGSLRPSSFRVLLQETVNQLGSGRGFNFLDLGSEAGMALLHFMLHPAIRQVTGIEIDVFWFKVAIQLLTYVASCARQANVHLASVVLVQQDFLNDDFRVREAMEDADIVYANNVQFDKKKTRVPKCQHTLPATNPFKSMINPNLAAKLLATTRRDRVVLAVFEYSAFEGKLTKKIKSLQLLPTWGSSTTEVALLLYQRHKQSDTPKRLRPHKPRAHPPTKRQKGVQKKQPGAPINERRLLRSRSLRL
jgi:hypothetical protein